MEESGSNLAEELNKNIMPADEIGDPVILPDIKAVFDSTLQKAWGISEKYSSPEIEIEPEA